MKEHFLCQWHRNFVLVDVHTFFQANQCPKKYKNENNKILVLFVVCYTRDATFGQSSLDTLSDTSSTVVGEEDDKKREQVEQERGQSREERGYPDTSLDEHELCTSAEA